MTALDLASADHVLEIPEEAFTSLTFGDYTLTPTMGSHPVVQSEHGFWAIPRGSGVSGVSGMSSSPFVPAGLDDFVFIIAFEQADSIATGAFASMYGAYGNIVFTETDIMSLQVAGVDSGLAAWPTPTPSGVFVVALTATTAQTFVVTSLDGVIASNAAGSTGSDSGISMDTDGGGDENSPMILGAWIWEGVDASAQDVEETVEAIRATFSGEGSGGSGGDSFRGPVVIGPAYQHIAVGAMIGPGHSPLVPENIYSGWLDGDLNLLGMTGDRIAHEAFVTIEDGRANGALMGAGTAGAGWEPVWFALFDGPVDGNLIVAAKLADTLLPYTPAEGAVMAFPAGALKFRAADLAAS